MCPSTSQASLSVISNGGAVETTHLELLVNSHDIIDPWLFSEDSFILRLPSRLQLKLLVPQELKARESLNDFVVKLASRLKLDGPTILCATVLLNRYYMRVPLLLSKYFVASAAIVISGKLNDTYRSPDKVALQGAVLKNPVPGQLVDEHCDLFWRWRDQILYREELILKTLNFDLAITLPYSIRDSLLEGPDSEPLLFTEKKSHILKNALALIEVLSLLPILVAYDVHTLFGAALVVIVLEGRKIFGDDSLVLPPDYLHLRLGTSATACFDCYRYIMRLIKYSLCDPNVISNKAAYKRLRPIPQQMFFLAANEPSSDKPDEFKDKGSHTEEMHKLTSKSGTPEIGNGQLTTPHLKQASPEIGSDQSNTVTSTETNISSNEEVNKVNVAIETAKSPNVFPVEAKKSVNLDKIAKSLAIGDDTVKVMSQQERDAEGRDAAHNDTDSMTGTEIGGEIPVKGDDIAKGPFLSNEIAKPMDDTSIEDGHPTGSDKNAKDLIDSDKTVEDSSEQGGVISESNESSNGATHLAESSEVVEHSINEESSAKNSSEPTVEAKDPVGAFQEGDFPIKTDETAKSADTTGAARTANDDNNDDQGKIDSTGLKKELDDPMDANDKHDTVANITEPINKPIGTSEPIEGIKRPGDDLHEEESACKARRIENGMVIP